MRDEENEERTRGEGEDSNSVREEGEEKDEDEVEGGKKMVEGQMMANQGDKRGANVVFLLCFHFVGGDQIGDNGWGGRGLVGWVGGRVVVVVTKGERRTEGTIGHGACSQLARVQVRGF